MKKRIAKIAKKRWRLETTNPEKALLALVEDDPKTAWKTLWAFDEDQYTAYQGLVKELNQINAPVIIRIVRDFTKPLEVMEGANQKS